MEQARCDEVASELGRNHDVAARLRPYATAMVTEEPSGAGPVFHLDDVSEIPFLQGVVGMEYYQLRARVRAGDGDLFAATCLEVPGYEAYNREYLGLGAPSFVYAPASSGPPSAVASACLEGEAKRRLVEVARGAGELLVHPYMGATPVWDMALELARASGAPVRVLAPPPPVTWIANDKAIFTRVANAVCDDGILGGAGTAETLEAVDAESLAEALAELATRHRRVAFKMTRCASAMGNVVVESEELLALPAEERVAVAARFLAEKEWSVGETVLAVAWLDIESSPSTQLWVPPNGHGEPRVDGIFEQLLLAV